MRAGLDFHEFAGFARTARKLGDKTLVFLERFLLREALKVYAEAKTNTPIGLTGDLANRWVLSDVVNDGRSLQVTISNSASYVSFVEFGHRTPIDPTWGSGELPAPKTLDAAQALVGKSEAGWHTGRFMVTLPMIELEREMPARFSAAWAKYAKSILGGK